MARFMNQRLEQVGQAPGSLIFTGEVKMDTVKFSLMCFDAHELTEYTIDNIDSIHQYIPSTGVCWLDIHGLHDVELMKQIVATFKIPNMVVEDVMHTGQRPKVEDFEGGVFITIKMLQLLDREEDVKILQEQISMLLLPHLLITFQEQEGDVFEPVRERIRQGRKRMRESGPDYLAYALMDVIIDNYGVIISTIGEYIEALDGPVMENPTPEVLDEISNYKREVSFLRKVTKPVKEMALQLSKMENEQLANDNKPYFRDLLEHATLASEATDSYRELLSDQLNIYHTVMSTRMNDIMKVLTVFAAIFIPLTFIAGVYGTNFEYVPELGYKYSYFVMWGVMLIVAVAMLIYFRRKQWI